MKLKLKTGVKIRIDKNQSNKGLNPIGRFANIAHVYYNDNWYKCSIKIIDKHVMIYNLYQDDTDTNKIIKREDDIKYKAPVGKFKKELIKYLLNEHKLNRRIFNLKKWWNKYKKKVWIFTTTLLICVTYYLVNFFADNYLMNLIATNLLTQTIFIFLALAGFISIFFPFTIRDEVSKDDAKKIAQNSYEQTKEEEERNKIFEERSTL